MRYLARRVLTGEWIDRDLPLSGVERARVLSGPGTLTCSIEPELRKAKHSDGLRVLEDWGTVIYAVDDDQGNAIVGHGLVVPATTYEEAATRLTCAGMSTYPHGFIYDDAKVWGPRAEVLRKKDKNGNVVQEYVSPIERPDPLQIVQDLWGHVQSFPNSKLGVRLVGNLKSTVRIGTNEEPYRLRWWEQPDVGQEIDSLATKTPFDYIEEVGWTDATMTAVDHRIRIGWPRLGTDRGDLRFALGENIIESTPVGTPEGYANDVRFIGNGTGSTMKSGRSTVIDGRLRRTRIVTDKTVRTDSEANTLARIYREKMTQRPQIDTIRIKDHPNARITAINPGDGIYVQTEVASYGEINEWCRVLSITQGEDSAYATLSLAPNSAFVYNSTTEVG